MFKNSLVLATLFFSLSASAAIIDNGTVTTDTSTQLDWLDLTETNNRSYFDISSKLGISQEFEGWRYASQEEVNQLFINLGLANGRFAFTVTGPQDPQFATYVTLIELLGNTFNEHASETYDYGIRGFTSGFWGSADGLDHYQEAAGLQHYVGGTYIASFGPSMLASSEQVYLGSYLVRVSEVPLPATSWLFISALIGLTGFKRKK